MYAKSFVLFFENFSYACQLSSFAFGLIFLSNFDMYRQSTLAPGKDAFKNIVDSGENAGNCREDHECLQTFKLLLHSPAWHSHSHLLPGIHIHIPAGSCDF